MGISNIISLLSGVALFLFGMSIMGDSLKKVAGNKLEIILYKLSSTPIKGLLLGTGVTSIIQSSSATSVMVVGFVNSGMMKFKQAIGIIMGAIIGTSVTGWVICLSYLDSGSGLQQILSTSTLTGVMAVTGIILRMFCKGHVKHNVGEILLGFAVLMFGMQAMSGAVSPLKQNEAFINLLTSFSNPLIGILVGIGFTSILQSASAAVGILQALSVTGAIHFDAALPIVMGIGIGASVPVLLSAVGASVGGQRTAWVYLVIDVLGVIVCAPIFYILNAIMHFEFMGMIMDPFSIAAMNSIYRAIAAVLLLPGIGLIEKLVCWMIKDKGEGKRQEEAMLLEERFLSHPALAVEQCRTTICDMAKTAQENLAAAFMLMDNYNAEAHEGVKQLEDKVDRYEDALGSYLIKLTACELSPAQSEDVSKYLHTLSDFERISDHSTNLAEVMQEIAEKKVNFSEQAMHEIAVLKKAVEEIVAMCTEAFVNNDKMLAQKIEPLEEVIDDLCDKMKMRHVERLQKGACTLLQGFIFNDLLNNFERISDHCSNIAVAMLELSADSFDSHEYHKSIKAIRTEAFQKYFDDFGAKYAL